MARKNNLPKTAAVTLGSITVKINQNGRVVSGATSFAKVQALIASGDLYEDGGMLFVRLDTLAKAFDL